MLLTVAVPCYSDILEIECIVLIDKTEWLQGPLMSWIEQECCLSMIMHLLLGCELELYNENELLMVFW